MKPTALSLYKDLEATTSEYYDKHAKLTPEEYFDRLSKSTTLYIGNLSFFTLEQQLVDIFS